MFKGVFNSVNVIISKLTRQSVKLKKYKNFVFVASSNNTGPKIAPCITMSGNKRSGKVSTELLLVPPSHLVPLFVGLK